VTATQQAGVEYGVPVIDLHQLSVDLYNSLGFCPVPGGDVSASTTGPVGDFFCDDHTHFSDTGAPEIAGLIVQALRDQGISLAAYLR
jgi:lysophospholipase L1-like esterase